MRRAIGSVLIGIGVFAVILAILLPTVVVPKSTKTPLNLNVTTIATGPAKLLNASTGQLVDANLRATRTVHSDSHASDSKNTTMDESLCIVNVIGTTPNCVAASDPKGRLLSVTTDRVTLPATPPADLPDGHKVVFGVRPEHFVLSSDDSGLPTRVAVVEPTGAETLVLGRVGEHSLQVLFKERRHFAPGDEIRLRPLPGTAHVFDAADGKRLG